MSNLGVTIWCILFHRSMSHPFYWDVGPRKMEETKRRRKTLSLSLCFSLGGNLDIQETHRNPRYPTWGQKHGSRRYHFTRAHQFGHSIWRVSVMYTLGFTFVLPKPGDLAILQIPKAQGLFKEHKWWVCLKIRYPDPFINLVSSKWYYFLSEVGNKPKIMLLHSHTLYSETHPKKIIKCDWSTWFSSSLTCFAMSVLVSQGLPMTTSAGETGELSVWRCWRWFFLAKQSDWVFFFSQEMASPIGIDVIRRMHIGTFPKEKQRATWVSTQIPCRTISYLQMKYWCTPFWFFHPSTLSCHPFHGGLRAGKSCKKITQYFVYCSSWSCHFEEDSYQWAYHQNATGNIHLGGFFPAEDQLFQNPKATGPALWNFSRFPSPGPFQRSDVSIRCWGWGKSHSRQSQGARTKSRCCPGFFPPEKWGKFSDGWISEVSRFFSPFLWLENLMDTVSMLKFESCLFVH